MWTPISCCAPALLSYSYYFAYIPQTICSQDRLSTKAEVYFGFSRTSWEQIVGGIIMENSTNTTIIRNLAVPRHFVSYLVFFSSIRVDPGPYIVTIPENTYPCGKHGEIKVHRSNACGVHLSMNGIAQVVVKPSRPRHIFTIQM